MSDLNPENFAEFCTQDGPESPSVGDDELPAVADLQPPDMVTDPRSQIVLLPQTLVER
ncbi:hypothetical protein [Actinoplanes regularis]|uniref:Uncharacterized protein n=1 Tax=Actinoplanes regularis TaxID=52697 RepID=A0A239HRH6_9ACTN|nr:hypothetical protein [Actinoplanes regularis]GIE91074.1 hypothetical protein Are01nite_75540 [Actinoplanes regularis]GLW32964.1 hypothetical protein Areg01_59020 [Actinoplanes regularis]SNS83922.1 hypothetical protein SAMN06264365_125119 [Actinoplanes regularis]